MYYYWIRIRFAMRKPKIMFGSFVIGYLITTVIKELIGAIFPVTWSIVWILIVWPLNWKQKHYIATNIKVKPKNCRQIVRKIINQIKTCDLSVVFTFKEYEVTTRRSAESTGKIRINGPYVLFIYKDGDILPLSDFRVVDINGVMLNEFFYKTVTKDDKLELEKVLFQII